VDRRRPSFPLPGPRVPGLSKKFRAKYLDGVRELFDAQQLDVPRCLRSLGDPAKRGGWLRRLCRKSWGVYLKRPFAGPRKLVDYLGRYTHRVAISDHRILECRNDQVRFSYRDRNDGDRRKTARLPAEQFLRRFLTHVLPDGFMRIRHYGLLANRGRRQRLDHVRRLLGASGRAVADPPPQTAAEWMLAVLGIDIDRCPVCGEVLQRESLPPLPEPRARLPSATAIPVRGPPARTTPP